MAVDDTVINSLRGRMVSTYDLNIIGASGFINPEYKAVVITAGSDRHLPGGWPEWHFRSEDPIEEKFQGTLNDWTSGRIKIYSTNPVYLQPIKGPFTMGTLGHLDEIITEHRGTFEDFFMQAYTNGGDVLEDPLKGFADFNTSTAAAQGNVGSAWNRHHVSFYPPKKARYIMPRFRIGTLATTKSHYLDAFQMEPTLATTPSAWQKPRRLGVKVVPTRKNWSTSPTFEAGNGNTTNSGGVTSTTSNLYAFTGSTSLVVSGLGGSTGRVRETAMVDVTPGEWITMSQYVLVLVRTLFPFNMAIQFYKDDGVTVVSTVNGEDPIQETTQNIWQRKSVTALVPEGASKARMFNASGTGVVTGVQFYLDAVLIEKSNLVGEFFHGGIPGADYLWKQGGTPHLTQSYYYEDRVKRNYILNRVLSENVPLGVAVADAEYALV